jgi:hypothetical protein
VVNAAFISGKRRKIQWKTRHLSVEKAVKSSGKTPHVAVMRAYKKAPIDAITVFCSNGSNSYGLRMHCHETCSRYARQEV